MIIATSLEPESYPAPSILALYKMRWQIELAFKRLKSLLNIDRLPAKNRSLARAWLNAHLLLALLIDDITQQLLDSPPVQQIIASNDSHRVGDVRNLSLPPHAPA